MSNETEFKLSSEAYLRGRKEATKMIIDIFKPYAQDLEEMGLHEKAEGVRTVVRILETANPDL